MSLTIDELLPKPFEIEIKGVKLRCKPLRLSDVLILQKVGEVLQDPSAHKAIDIKQSQSDLDEVVGGLIPELAGKTLNIELIAELLTKLMENVSPDDNKELKENKVNVGGQDGPKG